MPPLDEANPLLTAVLAAMAGVRDGQRVLVLGDAPLLKRALGAAAGGQIVDEGPADVVVAVFAPEVPTAVASLAPDGRVVGVAADMGAAKRTTERYNLALQYTEVVGTKVAWSARLRA